uniref:DZF domain-containing protein n=1 Tax=Mesocestoides corti TaxID=53468 RepID=A0A5K3FHS9_MESCO
MQFNSPDNQRTESQVYTPPVYMRQQGPVRYGVDSHILSSQQSSPQQSHQVYTPSYPQLHYPVANAYGHGGARQSYGGGGFFAFGGPGPDYRPSMRSPRGFGGRGRFTRPASQNKGSHSDSVDAIHHYCDVCKVSCIGKQSYDAHLAGQKHKKKALQQSNDLLDCPSTLYYCEICKVSCFGREPYDAHLCGQKHKRNATALMSGKVISADEMAAEYFCEVCSIACRGKCSFDAHLVGSKHLKKLRATASNPSEYRCELCQVDCRTQAFYHLHLNGPRHKDNIARQERGETPLISYVCEVCDVDCTSQIPYEMHLTGQKHKTNLAKLEKGEASLQAFVCDICNMDCRSEASYASHLDGQKHRKNQAKLLNNGLSSYLSEVCDIGCGNQGLYDNLLIDQTFVGGASGSERGDTGVYLYDEWEPGYCSQESYESQMCSHTHRTDEPRLVYPESFVPFTANYDCTAHMGGQKHLESVNWKAQGESGENALSSVKTNELSCPLCNIKCTGVDTYKTHLTGRQHQRAVKLQTELGKAIPDCDAVAINAEKAAAAAASSQSAHAKKKRSSNSARIDSTDVDASISDDCIEEVKNGKSSVFCCRVCDCNFSDVNAKSLHLKGKKHQSALRKLRGAGDSVATTSTSGRPQVRQLSPAAAVARAAMPPPLPQQSFFGNPRIPGQTSSRFFRPLAVFVPPGQQAQQIGLPSHMLADERYMQTKLREILPSEQENSIMKLAVASVESALGRILRAQASDDERNQPRRGTRLPKGAEGFEAVIGQRDVDGVKVQAPTHDSVRPLSGVFRVGALASGLLLRGQHTAEMVLVLEKLPPAHYLTEVAEELEELLKESCKDHVVIVATIDGALVVHVTPSTLKESASASTAGAAPIAVSVRVRLTSTQILGNKGCPGTAPSRGQCRQRGACLQQSHS